MKFKKENKKENIEHTLEICTAIIDGRTLPTASANIGRVWIDFEGKMHYTPEWLKTEEELEEWKNKHTNPLIDFDDFKSKLAISMYREIEKRRFG